MPVYDPESMGIVAGQVERLKDEFDKTKGKVKGVEGESPFGEIEGAEDAPNGVSTFHNNMNAEFDAGARIMTELGTALRKAAGLIAETEQVHKDNLKVNGQGI
ncbi:hypothetical protein [Amycolatopsis suaedae]|uniref:PE domain-containing protein n=1 Tax=Amycolatopsis suaedae TaxID=2510978 RepID=A0A4V2EMJ2_9PSEU|nr:hypothetical protein [Amycolatopsis suaedae]RZQ65255.1 hypothetical protein EWH70_05055 [Amycolatopsis suaedae]